MLAPGMGQLGLASVFRRSVCVACLVASLNLPRHRRKRVSVNAVQAGNPAFSGKPLSNTARSWPPIIGSFQHTVDASRSDDTQNVEFGGT